MAKLLLMIHDPVLTRAYTARFAKAGFEIEHRATAHDGLARARQWRPELIVLDLALPGIHGLDVLKMLRDVPWLIQVHVVLLIERTLLQETLDECLLWGADSYLYKDATSVDDVVTHLQSVRSSLHPDPPQPHIPASA